jgi:NAD(P)-dependent dehydrogenase (short-subunit alcohol dehydrogenase family)
MELKDRRALIVGGTSGIGRSIAQRFVAEGAMVAIVGRNQNRGEQSATEIDPTGNRVRYIAADVTRADDVEAAVDTTLRFFGGLDIVVNSAGTALRKNIVDTTPAEWDSVIASNLRSVYLVCRATLPHLVAGSCIINISSVAGQKALPLRPAYGAAKAGVIQLTRQLALEYAEHGIRVNCISPGGVATEMLRRAAIAQGRDPDRALEEGGKVHPLGRLGTPEEIAHAAVYLASPLAGFTTGIILNVDGGVGAS